MKHGSCIKGVTLVEVIVSMLIVSIILIFATSFFFTGGNMFSNSVTNNNAKIQGDSILKFVSDNLKYASKVEILSTSSDAFSKYSNAFYIKNDTLGLKKDGLVTDNVYGDDFYGGNILQIIANTSKTNSIVITVKILDENNNVKYSTSDTIKLVNLSIEQSTITIDDSLIDKDISNPIILFEEKLDKLN